MQVFCWEQCTELLNLSLDGTLKMACLKRMPTRIPWRESLASSPKPSQQGSVPIELEWHVVKFYVPICEAYCAYACKFFLRGNNFSILLPSDAIVSNLQGILAVYESLSEEGKKEFEAAYSASF